MESSVFRLMAKKAFRCVRLTACPPHALISVPFALDCPVYVSPMASLGTAAHSVLLFLTFRVCGISVFTGLCTSPLIASPFPVGKKDTTQINLNRSYTRHRFVVLINLLNADIILKRNNVLIFIYLKVSACL